MTQRHPSWQAIDPLHRNWCFQIGEIKGRMSRLQCQEFAYPPTAHNCALYLHTTLDQQLRVVVVDDPMLFTQHFVAGFLLGYGVIQPEIAPMEVPF